MGDWNPRANDIFLKAIEAVDPAGQIAVIDAECGGDASLRQEVEALLSGHQQTAGILENPPTDSFLKSIADAPVLERVGSVIGPYKLVAIIGEGGMGTVFRAEQTKPVRRTVALKVIKAGMDTRKVVARFEAERQTLAVMDHHNIAKVLDAGSTPAGRPFFVMELVVGVPLTQYCDEKRLTPAERIELFLPVCRAVQHAHQKGIIHRDIKPTNVLVGMYDGVPVPKVIDFGVAKATGRAQTEDPDLTALGMVVGTLQYMSPEQAETDGQDVDTRSDVYSLGVLLYELLTGTTPVTKEALRDAAMAQALKVIREQDPPRPSTRLNQTDTLATVAATRGTEPARLTGILRGELDWIVMKALEKDRGRRYDSANSLVADLLRYQADEPVEAHPPSLGYRLTKTFRRHRAGLITTAAIIALLLAGAGVSTWQAVRATREKNAKEIARHEAVESEARANSAATAERAAATAERAARNDAQRRLQQLVKANGILTGIFRDLDPASADAGKSTIQQQLSDQLTHAAAEFDADALEDPRVRGDTLLVIGSALDDLSHAKEAIDPLTKACDQYRTTLGPDAEPTRRAVGKLANAYLNAGNFARAIEIDKQVLDQAVGLGGTSGPAAIAAASSLGQAYDAAGMYTQAVPIFEKAAADARHTLSPTDPLAVTCACDLGTGYLRAGQTAKAIPVLEAALAQSRKLSGPDSSSSLLFENNLATVYQKAGRFPEAEPLLVHVLDRRRATLGPNHRDTLGAINNLAGLDQELGHIDLAVGLYESVLKTRIDRDGPAHPATVAAMSNLAMAYLTQGRPDAAAPLSETAFKSDLALFGPDNPTTIEAESNLAAVYSKSWRPKDAVPLLEDALRRNTAISGPDHPDTLIVVDNLGLAYLEVDRKPEGLALLRHGFERRRATLGPDHPSTLMSQNNVGFALIRMKERKAAVPIYEEVVQRRSRVLGPDHPLTNDTLIDLASIRFDLGQTEEGLADCDGAADSYRRFFTKQPMTEAGKLEDVGKILSQGNQFEHAEKMYGEALAIRLKEDPDAWQSYYCKSMLGYSIASQRRFETAEPLLRQGYDGLVLRIQTVPATNRGVFVEATNWLASLYHSTGREALADETIRHSDDLRKNGYTDATGSGSSGAPQPPAVANHSDSP